MKQFSQFIVDSIAVRGVVLEPLFETAKSDLPLHYKILDWIDGALPFRIQSVAAGIRYHAETQIKTRRNFPRKCWEPYCSNLDGCEKVLALLGDNFLWPNHYFIPSDPLHLVSDTGDVSDLQHAVADIADELCAEHVEVEKILRSSLTVGEFIQGLFPVSQ